MKEFLSPLPQTMLLFSFVALNCNNSFMLKHLGGIEREETELENSSCLKTLTPGGVGMGLCPTFALASSCSLWKCPYFLYGGFGTSPTISFKSIIKFWREKLFFFYISLHLLSCQARGTQAPVLLRKTSFCLVTESTFGMLAFSSLFIFRVVIKAWKKTSGKISKFQQYFSTSAKGRQCRLSAAPSEVGNSHQSGKHSYFDLAEQIKQHAPATVCLCRE